MLTVGVFIVCVCVCVCVCVSACVHYLGDSTAEVQRVQEVDQSWNLLTQTPGESDAIISQLWLSDPEIN